MIPITYPGRFSTISYALKRRGAGGGSVAETDNTRYIRTQETKRPIGKSSEAHCTTYTHNILHYTALHTHTHTHYTTHVPD
jgi:hypothetical protein